jgi:hypothetical protein
MEQFIQYWKGHGIISGSIAILGKAEKPVAANLMRTTGCSKNEHLISKTLQLRKETSQGSPF